MGRTLNLASLPRDASGRVDVAAVERTLAEIAGATPPMRSARVASEVLLERLAALGFSAPLPAKPNGHAVKAPPMLSTIEPVRRETHSPASPDEPIVEKSISPTDVRGIGRVGLAPVTTDDLEEKLSLLAAAPAGPEVDAPINTVEEAARAESPDVVLGDDVDLGSLPPLDARGSVRPPPMEPVARPLSAPLEMSAPLASPAPHLPAFDVDSPIAPPSASNSTPPAHLPPARPLFPPLGSASSRSPHASIPVLAPTRLSQAAAAEEVAAVGAVFDEFLGSAPVEPTPRPPAPLSVPRATSGHFGGSLRAPSVPVPGFRAPAGAGASTPLAPPAAPAFVSDDEAIEPLEMDGEVEMEEMEEIAAPLLSKSPPPLMSRPPALPPLPPRKR